MNKTQLWSSTNTKSHLIPYTEGLACAMWDDGVNNYTFVRTEQTKWYVMRKTHMMSLIDSVPIKDVRDQLMFYRVRVVTISDDGFMSCSCGAPQRYLMPYRHICNILKDVKLFQPSLFNLRWWNKFNYFHKKHMVWNLFHQYLIQWKWH